jgi:hypothetical protein
LKRKTGIGIEEKDMKRDWRKAAKLGTSDNSLI